MAGHGFLPCSYQRSAGKLASWWFPSPDRQRLPVAHVEMLLCVVSAEVTAETTGKSLCCVTPGSPPADGPSPMTGERLPTHRVPQQCELRLEVAACAVDHGRPTRQ